MILKSCKDCIYFNTSVKNYGYDGKGICHRYPKIESKEERSWCGEFLKIGVSHDAVSSTQAQQQCTDT